MNLVFATHNPNKLSEVKELLQNSISLKGLDEIGCFSEIPETGNTIEVNATQKSSFVANKYQINCFADDTGLEVEYLNGEPGVYSARYAGEAKDPNANIELLLSNLKGVENRKARFKTVISLIINNEEFLFKGIVNGVISESPIGSKGFGYDPIFIPDGYTKTFAEMDFEVKNTISHRALAVNKLIGFLNQL
ncbi:non-canonical purine NTP diphosphatase [Saccharicrinis aurantiacus]|uniref:non-canonical purine NTP diphosphatase n=1 Tax=Saccharicrinis aurantiacus TaxID=1849719 RepID=UPI0008381E41|nr:non-canonical purine NTP diphosphatase [Saccharicrinis aurantiacus]